MRGLEDVCVCVCKRLDMALSMCRGTGADLPILSNEAMASQWKHSLISCVYLRNGQPKVPPKMLLFLSLASMILYGCCNLSLH